MFINSTSALRFSPIEVVHNLQAQRRYIARFVFLEFRTNDSTISDVFLGESIKYLIDFEAEMCLNFFTLRLLMWGTGRYDGLFRWYHYGK